MVAWPSVRSCQARRAVEVRSARGWRVLAACTRRPTLGFWSGVLGMSEPYRLSPARGRCDAVVETRGSGIASRRCSARWISICSAKGRHRDFARVFGAHAVRIDGVDRRALCRVGAQCAPRFRRRQLQCYWDGRRHPMRLRHGPACGSCSSRAWRLARFTNTRSLGPDGGVLPLKADPVAQQTERPPATGSVVPELLGAGLAAMRTGWRARAARQRRMRRCPSTKCMPCPGCRNRHDR